MIAGFVAFNASTLYYYFNHVYPKIKHQEVENRGAYLATLPLLLAEKDRAYVYSTYELLIQASLIIHFVLLGFYCKLRRIWQKRKN